MTPPDSTGFQKGFWSSNECFQSVIDYSLDGVITVDCEGAVLDWNRRAEIIFGWSREEVLGKDVANLIFPPSKIKRSLYVVQQLIDKQSVKEEIELIAIRRDKQKFPILVTLKEFEWNGETLFNAFIRDIARQKDAERLIAMEKLETVLFQQASLFTASTNVFEKAMRICLDNLGKLIDWPIAHIFLPDENGQHLRSSGIWYLKDSFKFNGFSSVTEKIRLSPGDDLAGQVWSRKEPVWIRKYKEHENIHQDRQNSNNHIQTAFGFPILMNNNVVAVFEFFNTEMIGEDINLVTLTKGIGQHIGKVIERLQWQEYQMRLAAIVESSGDAIIGKSLDGTITSWNKGAEDTYQWTAEEAIGQTISLILPPGLTKQEPEILEAMRSGKRLNQFETRRKKKNGEVIDVSLTVSPIRDFFGKVVGSSVMERDISQRIRREKELLKAREEAEKASQTQGEFLAMVSHELRTPMNAILGMLELTLQDENLSAIKRDYLETAKDSADSLLLLVNDILDFSRLEAGRFELDPISFDLRELLDDTIKTLSMRAYEKGLELACQISSNVPHHVIGDPVRLRQILINLTGNAIKYTEQGEVVVKVKRVDFNIDNQLDNYPDIVADEERICLEFTVSDTGIGITPEDQERIFAPFSQADASTTRKYSGTGLGLAIANELVGLMNGKIWLESELGKGSDFNFDVILTINQQSKENSLAENVSLKELHELPVLIVDDNKTNLLILEELLSNWSMNPTVVESARHALTELENAYKKQSPYPLLIVDALMPETDGFMFLEQAKENGYLRSATILMLSSVDRQVFHERCEEIDISVFLEKPVSQADLMSAIRTAINGPETISPYEINDKASKESLRILIAEDTTANQKVITAILDNLGHQSVIANNGREVIEYHSSEWFDVILMDVQMPTIDGFQATTMIRENEKQTKDHIPIIAMTAYAMKDDRNKCLAVGMDGYISKPINLKKLIRLLEKHVPKPSSRRSKFSSRYEKNTGQSSDSKMFNLNQMEAQQSNCDHPLIDMDAALARLAGDPSLLAKMVQYFFEDAPILLNTIREEFALGHSEEVRRAAHSLKGLCANFDAKKATEVAYRVETMSRTGDLSNISNEIEILEQCIQKLFNALTEWKAENS